MAITLTPIEVRVIGCLLEKEIITPDQYPLSLNALTNACNQKSNRDPVYNLSELEIQETLDALAKKHFVVSKTGFGSRVEKFQHRFCNSQYGSLHFTEQELGIIITLLLRGPQTPGELRARTNRLCKFTDVREVEHCLTALSTRDDGPFVVQLPREPGKREIRYMHLFSGEWSQPEPTQDNDPGLDDIKMLNRRLTQLEQQVQLLVQRIENIEDRLG